MCVFSIFYQCCLPTLPMMSLICHWLQIDDVIAVGGIQFPIFSLAQQYWAQSIAYHPCDNIRPTDEKFKDFFHSDEQISLEHISSDTYVPILDDPITVLEVNEQVKDLKSKKAAGIDGVPRCPKTFTSCMDRFHYISHE